MLLKTWPTCPPHPAQQISTFFSDNGEAGKGAGEGGPVPPGKVRKQVSRQEVTTDEKGYMVTKTVTEWQLVDAEEAPAPKPSRKRPSPTKPAGDASKKAKKKGTPVASIAEIE